MATIPPFVPVIGGSFDSLADQQRGWAGFNANVQRQNLDSFAQANNARNNYFQTVAEMQRADAQRQQAEDAAAQADAVRQYQFNVNAALDKNQQEIEKMKIGATTAAKDYADKRKQALLDAQNNESAAAALAEQGHFNSLDEINKALPDSTPLVKSALWDRNQQARQQLTQQYDFAGDIASKENKKSGLTDFAASLPNSKDVKTPDAPGMPWWLRDLNFASGEIPGAIGRWLGTSKPDTSWYDQRKQAIGSEVAGLGKELAPLEKQGLDAQGIVLDPQTGKYKPANTPSWIPTAQTAPPAQPQPKQLDRATAAAYLNKANGDKNLARQLATKDGYVF